MSERRAASGSSRRLLRWALPLLGAVVLAVVAAALVHYRANRRAAELALWNLRLQAQADQGRDQLFPWFEARRADAIRVASQASVRSALDADARTGDPRTNLSPLLNLVVKGYGYRSALVLDGRGRTAAASSGAEPPSPTAWRLVESVMAGEPADGDRSAGILGAEGLLFAAVVVAKDPRPSAGPDPEPAGIVLLEADAQDWLRERLEKSSRTISPARLVLGVVTPQGVRLGLRPGDLFASTGPRVPPEVLSEPGRAAGSMPALDDGPLIARGHAIPLTNLALVAVVPRSEALAPFTGTFRALALAATAFALAIVLGLFALFSLAERRHLKSLASEEARYRLLRDNGSDVVLFTDTRGRILETNRAACEVYGYSKSQLESMRVHDLRAPEDAAGAETALAEAGTRGFRGVVRHRRSDGTVIPMEAVARPATLEGETVILAVLRDITERQAAEDGLRESERRMATLMGILPGMAYRRDNDPRWTMRFVSEGSIQLTGYRPEELVDSRTAAFGDLIHEDDRERVWKAVQEAVEQRRPFRLTYRLRARSGRIRYAWEQGAGVFDDRGALVALEGFISDETVRVEAQEELRSALEQLSEAKRLEELGLLLGGMAHEVRNPLFAMSTVVAALEKKFGGDPRLGEYVGHLKDQTRRVSALMSDLLVLGRPIEEGAMVPCALQEVLAKAREHALAGTDHPASVVALEVPRQPVFVLGLAEKLDQIFVNLLSNALAFTPEGGRVHCRLAVEGGYAVATVTDSGPGIAPSVLPGLFKPFASKRKGGTGLGLAIVQRLVTAHRGEVSGANNDPLPGATFTVTLPLAPAPGRPAGAGQGA